MYALLFYNMVDAVSLHSQTNPSTNLNQPPTSPSKTARPPADAPSVSLEIDQWQLKSGISTVAPSDRTKFLAVSKAIRTPAEYLRTPGRAYSARLSTVHIPRFNLRPSGAAQELLSVEGLPGARAVQVPPGKGGAAVCWCAVGVENYMGLRMFAMSI